MPSRCLRLYLLFPHHEVEYSVEEQRSQARAGQDKAEIMLNAGHELRVTVHITPVPVPERQAICERRGRALLRSMQARRTCQRCLYSRRDMLIAPGGG